MVWDSQTGEMLNSLVGHTNMVPGLAFSHDGTRLASAGLDGTAKVWDLASGEEFAFRGHAFPAWITGVAFSQDGKSIFAGVGDDKLIYQWDVTTGREVKSFSSEGKEIFGIALSPDGSLLAAGDQDGNIHLWDVESGKKLNKLSGHAGLVYRVAFNLDGSRLASAGFDRLAKVWDVKSGSELSSLYGNASNVFGVSFSPDGERLATAGADGSIRTYTLELDNLIALARIRLTRTLTDEECRKFLHAETCP
jgi:WD40 repeat protein